MGDYIDRGPNSAQVVEKIIEMGKSYETIALMGNHEQMFIEFFEDKNSEEASLFIINGGTATLASYSENHEGYQIPEHHKEFYKNLKYYFIDDEYIFVHAGLPNIPVEEFNQYHDPLDFLWLRKSFFKSEFNWKKPVVHGHTPVKECFMSRKRINIDTGCVYGNKLTALELPSKKLYQIPKAEKPENTYYQLKGSARKSERFSIDLPAMLQMECGIAMCKAIDFSETGVMIMYDAPDDPWKFNVEDEIEGMIGIEEKDLVPFKGVVKRIQANKQATFYGIEFSKSPFDLTRSPEAP